MPQFQFKYSSQREEIQRGQLCMCCNVANLKEKLYKQVRKKLEEVGLSGPDTPPKTETRMYV